ncbi:MAG: NERD domain-containing protein [Candidatus Aenigmarchaeota archaeon]|nr:NERD domain-containing protein [Candidatus Aenigmarchaeota archaeon]
MVDISSVVKELESGKDLDDILQKYDWKSFEEFVSDVFKENEFSTKLNFRFKTTRRYEIDVVAINGNKIFCVDCKWWGSGRYKKSGLKKAVTMQENRIKEFRKFLRKNPINDVKIKYEIYPLLVTLHDEDMIRFKNTFLVPVWKLNKALNDNLL